MLIHTQPQTHPNIPTSIPKRSPNQNPLPTPTMKPTILLASALLCLTEAPTGALAACGKITNNSGKTLRYTTNPNPDLNARPGRCRFWNWYDGDGPLSLIPRDKTVSCDQVSLASGSSAGNCPVDVDGFTFPNDAYW